MALNFIIQSHLPAKDIKDNVQSNSSKLAAKDTFLRKKDLCWWKTLELQNDEMYLLIKS